MMDIKIRILSKFRENPNNPPLKELATIFREELPSVMLEEYKASTKYQVRALCVQIATGFCRRSSDAFELGKLALYDKSKYVRFRGRQLLACSLRQDAIKELMQSLEFTTDENERLQLLAVIDAIEHQNHT